MTIYKSVLFILILPSDPKVVTIVGIILSGILLT